MILIIFAFLSGLATVASPCVLPVLPMVLSTSVGAGRRRPLGVVLGLTGAFTVATLAVAAAAQALALPTVWLRTVTIVALGVFGLSMLVPAWGRAFERWFSPLSRLANSSTQRSGLGGGLLIGAGLGLLWAPCVGPIMGSVLALAVSSGVSYQLVWITLAYAVGCGLPLLAIGYGARGILAVGARHASPLHAQPLHTRLGPRTGLIRQAFGALTLLACLALLFGYETRIQNLVPTGWTNALTTFERQENVQKELDKLEIKAQTEANMTAAQAPAVQPAEATTQPEAAPSTDTPVPAANTTIPPTNVPIPPTDTAVPPTATAKPARATNPKSLDLPDLGPAPELVGLTDWVNSEPLTLKSLRGKVVIVDFWTFGCYNCRNTRPYVRALYDKYRDQGLEILGVHTPEFAHERVLENVRAAAKEQGVTWPIALDPDYKTWNAFNNRYWPAFYFIDAQGRLRYTHFGEGNYEYNEKVVQQLLSEADSASK